MLYTIYPVEAEYHLSADFNTTYETAHGTTNSFLRFNVNEGDKRNQMLTLLFEFIEISRTTDIMGSALRIFGL